MRGFLSELLKIHIQGLAMMKLLQWLPLKKTLKYWNFFTDQLWHLKILHFNFWETFMKNRLIKVENPLLFLEPLPGIPVQRQFPVYWEKRE